MTISRCVMSALAVLCTAIASAYADSAPGLTVNRLALQSYMDAQLRHFGIPGASLAITRGTQIVHLAGFGMDGHGRPVTPETPFYVGSISKAFTAFAVLQLAEAGRLNLDQPLYEQMPEFRLEDRRAATITPRHLLSHTSGLTDRYNQEWDWPQAHSLAETLRRLRNVRLAHEPGSRIRCAGRGSGS